MAVPRRLPAACASLVLAVGLVALAGTPAGAKATNATVTIVHGLPNFTADIYVNGDILLDGFNPTEITEGLELPPGSYDVAIREVGAAPDSKPVLSDTLALKAGMNVSVVAHVSGAGDPTLSVFSNDLAKVPAGRSRLVVRSVAQAPAVDFDVDGSPVVTGVASGDEGQAVIQPGSHSISVAADGSTLVKSTDLSVDEGTSTVVYLIGSQDEGTLDLMQQSIVDLASAPGDVLTGTGGLAAGNHDEVRWPLLGLVIGVLCAGWVVALRRSPREAS
jgi:uncharacterized protein DUF4397